jgi:hypothetical protein
VEKVRGGGAGVVDDEAFLPFRFKGLVVVVNPLLGVKSSDEARMRAVAEIALVSNLIRSLSVE